MELNWYGQSPRPQQWYMALGGGGGGYLILAINNSETKGLHLANQKSKPIEGVFLIKV